jgi:hypothetical protein
MRSHRKTTPIAAVLTLALVALVPSAADANPLLSGYGGPGQGDQAIIGAALVNGPGQGGSSGGGGGEAPTGAVNLEAPSASTTPSSSSSTANGHRAAGAHRHRSGAAQTRRSASPAASSQAATSTTALPPASTEASSGGTLGLSGSDLLYVLLAIGGLVVAAVATRQLAGRPQPEGGSLKG